MMLPRSWEEEEGRPATALRIGCLEPPCSWGMTTWAPKVCKMMAFRAVILGLGLLCYVLLGFRQLLFKDNKHWPGLEFRVWGFGV